MSGVLGGLIGSLAKPTADYELIQTTILADSSTTTVTVSNIPQTYQHLELRLSLRITNSVTSDKAILRMNNDTSTNYWSKRLEASGSASIASSSSESGQTSSMPLIAVPGASNETDLYGAAVVQLPDYRSTTKHKMVNSLTGYPSSVAFQEVLYFAGLWRNSSIAAITSLTITVPTRTFASGSRFSLYGIRG